MPFFVVIIRAPLAPALPYRVAAEAPLSTVIDSISSGLILDAPSEPCTEPKSLPAALYVGLLIGTPSTTISALLLPWIERLPRNTILAPLPGPPEPCAIIALAILPCNELIRLLGSRTPVSSDVFTDCVAYTSDFACRDIPNAVTTTSFNEDWLRPS